MEKIIDILMNRDGITRDDAIAICNDARQQMADCNFDAEECEDIMQNSLGLELDYIFSLLL